MLLETVHVFILQQHDFVSAYFRCCTIHSVDATRLVLKTFLTGNAYRLR